MNILVFLNLLPQEYLEIKKTTTVGSIKKYLKKYNNIERIQFFVNDKTESKILDKNKYDEYNLSSIWKDLNNPAIYLYTDTKSKINPAPTVECLKVSFLRKNYKNIKDIDLEKWMSDLDNHLYVGRKGRIWITDPKTKEKNIFHYKDSKWKNPFKVSPKDYTLEESIKLYKKHIKDNNLIKDLHELGGKTLGCFCDQKNDCHAKVLVDFYKEYVKN